MPENLTTALFESSSRQIFEFALKNKIWLPRGLGAGVVAYPLLVTDIVSDDVRSFVQKYCPKHYASTEFPAVVELSSKSVLYCNSTPIRGALYYRGFRKEVERLYRPE